MKLSYFKGLFKTSLGTVISVENPYGDYYSVKLKVAHGITWVPGEHGVFTLPHKKVLGKKFRAFSVASIPEEGYLLIGTRTGNEPSSYKQALITMEAGEKVNIRGPFGWFVEQDKISPMVMLATGVGVTPIRALMKSLKDENTRDIHLVFASADYYLYEETLDEIALNNSHIHLYKTSNPEDTQDRLRLLSKEYGNHAWYYLSGSINVLKSTKSLLKDQGIKGKRIINDPFFGY